MGKHIVLGACLALASTACAGTVATPSGSLETSPPQATAQAPAVSEILRRMSDRYATASTYSDEATLHEVMRRPDGETSTTTGTIRTRWKKPDRLLVEIIEKSRFFDHHLAVWSSPAGVKGWFLGRLEDHTSLDDILGAYKGVSHGITALVPRWLAAGKASFALDYVLDRQSACGTTTCFVLVSKTNERMVSLWVEHETYALRRYRTVSTVVPDPAAVHDLPADLSEEDRARFLKRVAEPFDVDKTIDYTPVFDAPLPAAAFDFTPPVDARH